MLEERFLDFADPLAGAKREEKDGLTTFTSRQSTANLAPWGYAGLFATVSWPNLSLLPTRPCRQSATIRA